jgi:branched-subunit amino acid aminotransferase/4-amino-4-deoxychorismate lyase
MAEQREGKIPTEDKAYLRTIETMSISDLTQALFTLSQNVDRMARTLRYFWIPLGIAVFAALLAAVFSVVF